MSRKLHDITLNHLHASDALKNAFTYKANVVSGLYVHFLNGYKPLKTTRISVTLKDPAEPLAKPVYLGSILGADAHFDDALFWDQQPADQNRMILEVVHTTALACAVYFNWDQSVFKQAYQQVQDANYVFKIETRSKVSPDKKIQAALLIERIEKKAIISVNFYERSGQPIRSVKLFESFPHEMFYGGIVKNPRWFSAHQFGVQSTTGELKLIADFHTGQSTIYLEPKQTSREILDGNLRRLLFQDLKTNEEIAAWINQ